MTPSQQYPAKGEPIRISTGPAHHPSGGWVCISVRTPSTYIRQAEGDQDTATCVHCPLRMRCRLTALAAVTLFFLP